MVHILKLKMKGKKITNDKKKTKSILFRSIIVPSECVCVW